MLYVWEGRGLVSISACTGMTWQSSWPCSTTIRVRLYQPLWCIYGAGWWHALHSVCVVCPVDVYVFQDDVFTSLILQLLSSYLDGHSLAVYRHQREVYCYRTWHHDAYAAALCAIKHILLRDYMQNHVLVRIYGACVPVRWSRADGINHYGSCFDYFSLYLQNVNESRFQYSTHAFLWRTIMNI